MTRDELIAEYPALADLEPGVRYVASRPMAERGRKVYPVWIKKNVESPYPVVTIEGLGYKAANELLAAFNNGRSSFDGRVW